MCGIIGIVGVKPVAGRLVESLKRLEYRGYDSAGIAGMVDGKIERRRAQGKLSNLEAVLAEQPLEALTGIGHTRWATHGVPSVPNAHPHRSGRVTLVHNGIIENFAELKAELQAKGHVFESQTDTEVVAHLFDEELKTRGPLEAWKGTLDQLTGAYALVAIVEGENDLILGGRLGPALVVGHGDGEMYLGSDALAVGPFTNRITHLEEGDYVAIRKDGFQVYDRSGKAVTRQMRVVPSAQAMVEKGNYRHFMEKEIYDQPESCAHTLAAYVDLASGSTRVPTGLDFANITRLQIVACGTASLAGMIARYTFERLARLPCEVEIASEFRYRRPALTPGSLALAISQSGETADTLAAMRYCAAEGLATAALVNVHESTMAREADLMLPTHAGVEIGVASTKAFTSQTAALLALAVGAAKARGEIDTAEEKRLSRLLMEIPRLVSEALQGEETIRQIAQEVAKARDVLYLGRGAMYPLALEGALKLKEISYIHAEGYAAGELKHGPIALVDEAVPIIVIAPSDDLFDKTHSNMSEVLARGGKVVLITDAEGARHAPEGVRVIVVPTCDPLIAPLIYAVPIQMLAYHVAVQKGADVDQPRNLAKSVTVE